MPPGATIAQPKCLQQADTRRHDTLSDSLNFLFLIDETAHADIS
jgi:hypothetical protein